MRGDAAPVNRLALERAWRGLTCSNMRNLLFGLALLLGVPAQATSWTATYELRAAGLRALEAVFIFDIDGPAYTVEVRTRSLGVVGLFATSSQRTVVEGVWQGDQARPRRYRAQGTFRGQPRVVTLDWGDARGGGRWTAARNRRCADRFGPALARRGAQRAV